MTSDTAFPDILSLLRHQAAVQGARVAIEDRSNGRMLSYAELLAEIETLARGLKAIGATRIGLVLPNGSDMSCALLACTVVGTALPFNTAYTDQEFATYFAQTGISVLVTKPDCAPAARRAATKLGLSVVDFEELRSSGKSGGPALVTPSPEAVAMVLLTSGSTGRAKRVPLTHHNVCTSARDVCRSIKLSVDDRCLSMWELFHVGGLVDLLLAPLHSGGVVIATQGFNTAGFFDALEQSRPTWFQAVPTALGEMTLYAKRQGKDCHRSSLRLIRSVAAALSPALMVETEQIFGVPVLQTFGMTEAGPLITSTSLDAERIQGSVGRSCGTEVAIFDPDWSLQSTGSEGEVAIRGPNVFAGYEADPTANAEAFRDGWFRTGDLGRIDAAGNLFLTGRIKELVNRGGEKVNLREVDDALLRLSHVQEAASFPVPHRTLGEDVAAAVVLRQGMVTTSEALRASLADQLAAFKIPRRILVVEALPRNAVGKIDRRVLAESAAGTSDAFGPKKPEDLNETETRLARIWAQELGLAKVGPDDDFITLGGDSLAALRMLLATEAEFDRALPDDVLTHLSTIRELAQILADSPALEASGNHGGHLADSEYRQFVAISAMGRIPALRPGSLLKVVNFQGGRKPLIWFFNSPATEMLTLSQFLPKDQPLYGGFSGGRIFERDDASLMRIARCYVEELKEVFPNGGIILGGNCQGGRVGWMVAKLLADEGIKVDALCFLEFSHPELAEFDGDCLMMFGRQSSRKHYRFIEWGKPGWDKVFKVRPVVSWIDGTHGGFFRADTVSSFVSTMVAFLEGMPLVESTLDSAKGRRVLALHQTPLVFPIYRLAYKIKARLRYGRKVNFNPFSGESLNNR
jgi:acyl-CoA synthetase (AMP-forming)/AMP-acid ligase II/acyl carrier protein